MTTTFSLLHATYKAGEDAVDVKRCWLEHADSPALVEHVFSMDADDSVSIRATEGHDRVINPSASVVTAVRNWNAAAEAASGDVFVVIADDLYPPLSWDTRLLEVIGTLDPMKFAFAIKVDETTDPSDTRFTLMRHPVVSKRFYAQLGLFDPRFRGVYCDDDFTINAFRRAVVLDGTRVKLEHRRTISESHGRINDPIEYTFGRECLRTKWIGVERRSKQAFFPAYARIGPRPRASAWAWRQGLIAASALPDALRRLRARSRRWRAGARGASLDAGG